MVAAEVGRVSPGFSHFLLSSSDNKAPHPCTLAFFKNRFALASSRFPTWSSPEDIVLPLLLYTIYGHYAIRGPTRAGCGEQGEAWSCSVHRTACTEESEV